MTKKIVDTIFGAFSARAFLQSQIETTRQLSVSPAKTFTEKTEFGYTTAKIDPVIDLKREFVETKATQNSRAVRIGRPRTIKAISEFKHLPVIVVGQTRKEGSSAPKEVELVTIGNSRGASRRPGYVLNKIGLRTKSGRLRTRGRRSATLAASTTARQTRSA